MGESVLDAVNESIDAALRDGRIDRRAQAAQIATMRKVAALMDEPGWPVVDADGSGKGRFDNVSPSTLLKFCEALGLNPEPRKAEKKGGGLDSLRKGIADMKVAK